MKSVFAKSVLVAAALFAAASPSLAQSAASATAPAESRVVYHVSEVASLRDALNNIINHMSTSPNSRITLLANANGVFGLVKGERDRQGDYQSTISSLQSKGVTFVACNLSMKKRNIDPGTLLSNVRTVESGVVELTRLQTQDHHAYIKP